MLRYFNFQNGSPLSFMVGSQCSVYCLQHGVAMLACKIGNEIFPILPQFFYGESQFCVLLGSRNSGCCLKQGVTFTRGQLILTTLNIYIAFKGTISHKIRQGCIILPLGTNYNFGKILVIYVRLVR